MDKRTTNRRLLKMAKLLEKNARNKKGLKFDLCDWGTVKNIENPIACGTTACAMGLAALSGEFRRQGLEYSTRVSGGTYNIDVLCGGFSGIDAAQKLFGIDSHTASFFFTPDYTPQSLWEGAKGERFLAKRIKQFVKTGKLA